MADEAKSCAAPQPSKSSAAGGGGGSSAAGAAATRMAEREVPVSNHIIKDVVLPSSVKISRVLPVKVKDEGGGGGGSSRPSSSSSSSGGGLIVSPVKDEPGESNHVDEKRSKNSTTSKASLLVNSLGRLDDGPSSSSTPRNSRSKDGDSAGNSAGSSSSSGSSDAVKSEPGAERGDKSPLSPRSNSSSSNEGSGGGGNNPSASPSSSSASSALTDFFTAATAQMQMTALATSLLNLPGYNANTAAYLQAAQAAAVSSGKPLANMLTSMAMLQSQQQQATLASAMASAVASSSSSTSSPSSSSSTVPSLPKRGRGSRGGSVGRPRGTSLLTKLKRTDS